MRGCSPCAYVPRDTGRERAKNDFGDAAWAMTGRDGCGLFSHHASGSGRESGAGSPKSRVSTSTAPDWHAAICQSDSMMDTRDYENRDKQSHVYDCGMEEELREQT